MYCGFLQFDSIPEIGFAHHFIAPEYQNDYTGHQKNFEVVCNTTGEIQIELYGRVYRIREGSIFIIFRELPIRLTALNSDNNEHYTIQLEMDYELSLQRDDQPPPDQEGILLPLVIPPGKEAEEIRKELTSIILKMERESEQSTFGASLRVLGIFQKMDAYARNHRKGLHYSPAFEKISRQVKRYIEDRLGEKITLKEIAEAIGKTPNYINYSFQQVNGLTIARYIAREKVLKMAEQMQRMGKSFEEACAEVALTDISYGYRLFKQYMGVTPGEYRKGRIATKKFPQSTIDRRKNR